VVPAAGGFCWRLFEGYVKFRRCTFTFSNTRVPFMSLGPVTDEDGSQKWYDGDGKLHRNCDLPAWVEQDGWQAWYKHGQQHRDGDMAAEMWPDGTKWWYQHGAKHRDGDMPAVVWPDGHQAWHKHGKLHRSFDLPAVVWPDGRQEWWVDGEQQTPADRAQTRRWSQLRAAFVGAVVVGTSIVCTRFT
jgi:hypothetical protein